jgi:hypothetical protein
MGTTGTVQRSKEMEHELRMKQLDNEIKLGKRPVAFRVRLVNRYIIFQDESEAQYLAAILETDYQGLYIRQENEGA